MYSQLNYVMSSGKIFFKKMETSQGYFLDIFIKLKTKNAFQYHGFVLNLNNSSLLFVFVPESEVDPNLMFNSTSASRKMSM